MIYTVNKLAQLAGITVRTLHYYDEKGLLKPSFSKGNGYRYYEEKELLRLQQILFFRELEFTLEQIKELLDKPGFDAQAAFEDQKKLLEMKKDRLDKLIQTITERIITEKGGDTMDDKQLFASFTTKQMEEYKEEAKKRWGDTEAWRQSEQRTKNWTKADYKRVAKEGAAWTQKMAGLMQQGLSAQSTQVQEMINQHYNALRTFYEPNYEMYKGLGQMYVDDPRFKAYYEKFSVGLASFMRDAMLFYVEKHSR